MPYAIDVLNERVRRIDLAAGTVSTLAGDGRRGCHDGPGSSATFSVPAGLAVSSDGRSVFVADYGNHLIRQVSTSDLA